MKKSFLRRTMIALILGVSVLFCIAQYAPNIDPYDDDSQYAYGENIGWLNFEPSEGPGVTVTDTEVTGFVWAENIGWVNLAPNYGGVTNDRSGNLGGYAWGENVGWINFNPTGGGVTIDNEGNFDGRAWGENIGWIHFQNLSIPYKVQTAWSAEVPPEEQIVQVLEFFDDSVGNETLVGKGPGKSAENRLNALRNMLEEAQALILAGDIDGACKQLTAAYKKCDGAPRPPDLVSGEAASELAAYIQGLITSLDCS